VRRLHNARVALVKAAGLATSGKGETWPSSRLSIAPPYFGAGLNTPTCANAASQTVVVSGARSNCV
jgi:hypothetical protein